MRADDASNYAASATIYIVSDGLDVILNVEALAMVTRIGDTHSRNFVEPTGTAYGAAAGTSTAADLSRS